MFESNENFISKLLEIKNATWTPSINLFKGVLWDELKGLAGYKPLEGMLSFQEREYIAKENYSYAKEIKPSLKKHYPNKFSWLDFNGKNYVTPVKNQGFCSSCVAFGSIAVIETMLRFKNMDVPNLSEAQLFFTSPGFSKDGGPGKHNCKTGWQIEPALDFLKNRGVISEELYPYDLSNKILDLPPEKYSDTIKITGSTVLNDHHEMKSWLSTIGPLIAAIEMKADIIFYGKGIYNHIIGNTIGGHCICVVGYNDEYDAWLCKNSWSNHWGEEGFFWIGYDQCGIGSQMWGIDDIKQN